MQRYYYSDGTEQHGPYSLAEIKEKGLRPNTKVWYDGLESWTDAKDLPELAGLFKNVLYQAPEPPPLPKPKQNPIMQNTNSDSDSLDSVLVGNSGAMPKNWLVESILCTIFCCLPFGIAAIVFAASVESKWTMKQYDAAHKAAKDAKTWVMVSFFVAAAFWALYLMLAITVGVGSSRGFRF